jgi:hypothetical protein
MIKLNSWICEDFFRISSFQWNDRKSPIAAVNASHFLPCELCESFVNEGLIFNIFEHPFEENCPIAAVNASHFLPCELCESFAKGVTIK